MGNRRGYFNAKFVSRLLAAGMERCCQEGQGFVIVGIGADPCPFWILESKEPPFDGVFDEDKRVLEAESGETDPRNFTVLPQDFYFDVYVIGIELSVDMIKDMYGGPHNVIIIIIMVSVEVSVIFQELEVLEGNVPNG
jgi:hypothetical protein